jgi:hypothetical protein
VNNFFGRWQSACVKLEDLKEYLKDIKKTLKIKFPCLCGCFREVLKMRSCHLLSHIPLVWSNRRIGSERTSLLKELEKGQFLPLYGRGGVEWRQNTKQSLATRFERLKKGSGMLLTRYMHQFLKGIDDTLDDYRFLGKGWFLKFARNSLLPRCDGRCKTTY